MYLFTWAHKSIGKYVQRENDYISLIKYLPKLFFYLNCFLLANFFVDYFNFVLHDHYRTN